MEITEAVEADEYVENLPARVVENIIHALSKNGAWQELAVKINCNVEELSKSSTPERQLIHFINKHLLRVKTLQTLLIHCQLYDVLRTINTNEPAKFESPEEDSAYSVKLCSPVSLPVEVCGSPFPDLQWYLNDTPLIGKTSPFLQLQNFSLRDAGAYTCKLTQRLNGFVTELTSHKYVLNVMETRPKVTVDIRDVQIKTHDDLTLCFEVIGYPEPRCFQWIKDDNQLIARTEYPQLRIQSADAHNAGRYYCVASNTVGNCHTRTAMVKVERPVIGPHKPEIIEQPSAPPVYFVGDWICFVCKVACAAEVKFTCFLNNKELIGSRNGLITTSSSAHHHQCEVKYHVTQEQMEKENWKRLNFKFGVKTAYCEVLSDDVTVQIKTRSVKKIFTARNKWALLVGNSRYAEMDHLPAASGDIQVMMNLFVELEFRVMVLSDLKRTAIQNAVRLFASFVQKGDYVSIYYAGHGTHSDGMDYLVPVDAKVTYVTRSMNVSVKTKDTSIADCTSCIWITNILQKCEPALIFVIYDACRTLKPKFEGYQSPSSENNFQTAANNFFSIFATSENYTAYEDDKTFNSCLVSTLQHIITSKISIQDLSIAVLRKFDYPKEGEDGIQVPKICGDLSLELSLTDPSQPHDIDRQENGVLQKWETLATSGGTIQDFIIMEDTRVEGTLHWNVVPRQNGVCWVVSNSWHLIVTLTQHSANKELQKMNVVIKLSTEVKALETNLTDRSSWRFPVSHLQDLKDGLDVELYLTYKGKSYRKIMHLSSPAISQQFYRENYID